MEARKNRAPANVGDLLGGLNTPLNPANVPAAPTGTAPAAPADGAGKKQTVAAILNGILDSAGYRRRLEELLGARLPQHLSAIIRLVNADDALKAAALEAPETVVQASIQCAIYGMPVDNTLGYGYIVAFKNKKHGYRHEAVFVIGYKGMIQLALRTGCYKTINVTDVREGEYQGFDRLRGEYDFRWETNEAHREKLPIIGYAAYYRLINGAEKTVYMSREAIEQHERENRKGEYMGRGWRENWGAMARKTVIRELLSKWGLMSIDYNTASPAAYMAVEQISAGFPDGSDLPELPGDPPAELPGDENPPALPNGYSSGI